MRGDYRRFHVILGDANMSEWATALKIGTTSVVLELIEQGLAPEIEIAQPIDATKSISRDQTYDWIIELTDGRKISAIDVQRIYLVAAQNSLKTATRVADGSCTNGKRSWMTSSGTFIFAAIGLIGWQRRNYSRLCAQKRNSPGATRGCSRSTLNIITSSPKAGSIMSCSGRSVSALP